MPSPKTKSKTDTDEKDLTPKTGKELFRSHFKPLLAPEGGMPHLPTRIAHVNSDKLGDLIAQYSAWREFCEDIHLSAVSDYIEAKAKHTTKFAELMIQATADDVTTKKAIVENNEDMKDLSAKLVQSEVYKEMIAAKLESFSNSLAMLSRELTRRGIINV